MGNKSQWIRSVSLTMAQGEEIVKILEENGCKNISQLCRKLVTNELKLVQGDIGGQVKFKDLRRRRYRIVDGRHEYME